MIFHENRLLADDSHVKSYLIFVENWERCRKMCRPLQSWVKTIRYTRENLQIYMYTEMKF